MAALDRRLQLLIDEDRYARVAAEAARRGASVSAVIREAIDLVYPSQLEHRRDAVARLLDFTSLEPPDLDDTAWGRTRDALEAAQTERFT